VRDFTSGRADQDHKFEIASGAAWVELAAATFSEQVIEADRWLQDHEHLNGADVDQQP